MLLAGLLVPQGMAYAGVAGISPQRGLYAALAGLVTYALLGSGRHVVVAPTSSAAALLAAAVIPIAGGDAARLEVLGSALAIVTGLVLLASAVLKLGAISDFVSRPVLEGFMVGLAITVIVKQVPKVLGTPAVHGEFLEALRQIPAGAADVHAPTAAISACALAALFYLSVAAPRFPAGLVVVAAGIVIGAMAADAGVAVTGPIPQGLPLPRLPDEGWQERGTLLQAAAGIAVVAFSEALGTGRFYAARHRYEISANRELAALGAANIAAGVLQGLPVGVVASASAVNDGAGARSRFSLLVAAAVVILALVLLTPVFAPLPQAVLGALVIHAMTRLIHVREFRRYVRLRRGWMPCAVALSGVLLLGLLPGMLLAVAANLVLLLRRLSVPGCAVLGRVPGTDIYVDIEHDDAAATLPRLLLLRIDGLIFFGNVDALLTRLHGLIRERGRDLRAVILSCETVFEIDVAGLDLLARLRRELAERAVELTLVRVHPRVRDLMARDGLLAEFGNQHVRGIGEGDVAEVVRRHSAAAG